MEYSTGKPGRIIAARLFEGESLYDCIESIAAKENVKAAAVLITGGIRKASVIAGPKQEKPQIIGDSYDFDGPGETLGVGTIYWDDSSPKLHIHAGLGKGRDVMVGCPRGDAEVFLILEVTIIEIVGLQARRELDPSSGFKLLKFFNE
jgi:predicted DNA-binding protein with PD1-like motif